MNVYRPTVEDHPAGGEGPGCLRVLLVLAVLWALAFGVTWNGKQYALHCSCDRGVEIRP